MTAEVRKNRRSLILLIAVFVLPIILAKLALKYQWFNYGVTNQGELLNSPQTLADVGIELTLDKQWLLLTVLPDNCDIACAYTLKGIDSTYWALGKESPRVTPVAISNKPLSEQQLALLSNSSQWQLLTNLSTHSLSADNVYIVDPLGNIVLTYAKPSSEQSIPVFGKAMLSDLKKMLKLSRIG